jgi:two-component system, response regulator YesN
MFKIFSFKNKNIFLSWLTSYILILLVPLIIITFAYREAMDVIESEINKAHSASLKQLQQVIDGRLRDIEKLSFEVGFNDKNISVLHLKDEIQPFHRVTIANMIKDLKVYKTANGFIDDFYIYYKNNDFITSLMGKYDTEEFYKFNIISDDITYEDWINILKTKHIKSYIPIKSRTYYGVLQNSIAFVQSLPIELSGEPYGTIVIVIDENVIREEINRVKWMEEGTVLIVDNSNNILASTGEYSLPESMKYKKLNKNHDVFNTDINGESMVVSYISSEINSWKYVSVLPSSVFMKKAYHVREISYYSIILCLMIGILAAYLLTKKNYNPLRKIINIFDNKKTKVVTDRNKGYDFIEESILAMINEDEKIRNRLNQQNDVIRNHFLCKILKGHIKDYSAIDDACESHDVKFAGKRYITLLFYIEAFDLNSPIENESESEYRDPLKMVYRIISNTVQELLGEQNVSYVVEVDEMLCCLINSLEEDNEKIKREIKQIVINAEELIVNNNEIFFSAAISDVHENYEGISKAYEECIKTFEYKKIMGGGKIINYNDFKAAENNELKNMYVIEEQKQFINSIKAKDFENSKQILNGIFKNNFDKASSLQMVKCKMFGIINMMFSAMEELRVICDKQFLKKLNLEEKLLNCVTLNELQGHMNSMLDEVMDYMGTKSKKESLNLKDCTMQFVEENYNNPDLSVSMIADKLQLSEVYLSRAFKNHTNSGLLEYIHKVRIERAKEIMLTENVNVKEVAERVGYYNSVALIRVFKKYEGVTPGKYIEMSKQT